MQTYYSLDTILHNRNNKQYELNLLLASAVVFAAPIPLAEVATPPKPKLGVAVKIKLIKTYQIIKYFCVHFLHSILFTNIQTRD